MIAASRHHVSSAAHRNQHGDERDERITGARQRRRCCGARQRGPSTPAAAAVVAVETTSSPTSPPRGASPREGVQSINPVQHGELRPAGGRSGHRPHVTRTLRDVTRARGTPVCDVTWELLTTSRELRRAVYQIT